ncbi:hypothetical protein KEM52_000367 [Ascosphaera acerosa]|nr:hypothetical protein KEM52_000367 [Ascosphaera acerosa]
MKFNKAVTIGALSALGHLAAARPSPSTKSAGTFGYNNSTFLLNGEPFQIIGGQMDPQRVPRQYWRQRLQMARAMGLNTILSYVYWNNFEKVRGEFDFTGDANVAEFFRIAQEEGLQVVLRPGPYICGEHEWGGFPGWLNTIDGMAVRTNNKPFLAEAERYVKALGKHLHDSQITQGGNILMVQLENEYGNFGGDKKYLQANADILRDSFDLPLYSTDSGRHETAVKGGQLPGVLSEVDGADPHASFAGREKWVTDPSSLGPLLEGEYYTTWFTWWGSNATRRHYDTASTMKTVTDNVDWLLGNNNSLSFYMFHGGTNWGFQNGAMVQNGAVTAVTTSYDYAAPLDESGRPGKLYKAIRQTLTEKWLPKGSVPDVPDVPPLTTVPSFSLKPKGRLFDLLATAHKQEADSPVMMEDLGQAYGYVLYEHQVKKGDTLRGVLKPGDKPRDRVIIYVQGKRVGVIDNMYPFPPDVTVSLKEGDVLQLLVENVGRVDTSQPMRDQRKGIVGDVTIAGKKVTGWTSYSLPMSTVPSLDKSLRSVAASSIASGSSPVVFQGSFTLPKRSSYGLESDTFLSIPEGVKGNVWVNGINIGRYWNIGPQQSLYLPGAFLRAKNDVTILELEPKDGTLTAEGVAERTWGNKPDQDLKGSGSA